MEQRMNIRWCPKDEKQISLDWTLDDLDEQKELIMCIDYTYDYVPMLRNQKNKRITVDRTHNDFPMNGNHSK